MLKYTAFAVFVLSVILSNENVTASRFKCITLFGQFPSAAAQLKRGDDQSIQNFTLYCESIQPCLNLMHHEESTQKAKTLCDSTKFVYKDECVNKLVADNSTCFKTWTPMREKTEKDKETIANPENLKVLLKEMCDNVHGKDGCMKKETIEKCGAEKWEEMKKVFIF